METQFIGFQPEQLLQERQKKLRRSSHDSVAELTDNITAWTEAWNANPKPYTWVKTADTIFESTGNYCQRISHPGH